jgi:hypothetical protein
VSSTAKVTRGKSDAITINLKLRWPADDDVRNDRIFGAIGKLLREVLTPEQLSEFSQKLQAERAKLASTGTPPQKRGAK